MNFGEFRFMEAICGCVLHTSEELFSAVDRYLRTIRDANKDIEKKDNRTPVLAARQWKPTKMKDC